MRRLILHLVSIGFFLLLPAGAGELFYNGIELPEQLPPPRSAEGVTSLGPMPVPYLDQPPAIIPGDVIAPFTKENSVAITVESTRVEMRWRNTTKHLSELIAKMKATGAIVTPFRNTGGFLYASVSHDRGESWSVPVQTNFPDSMARSSAGRLPDGSNYLINIPDPGKMNRSLLTIGLSRDGILFDRAWLVRGDPTTQRFKGKGKRDGWQYPDSLVWKNALWVVYSANKEDIVLTRISLEQFE